MEAEFRGGMCEAAANRARSSGANFVLSGAVAAGECVAVGDATFRLRSPRAVAGELRERAAPGQLLLGGTSWSEIEGLELLPAASIELQGHLVPVFVLRDLGRPASGRRGE